MADPQMKQFPNGKWGQMDAEGDWVPSAGPQGAATAPAPQDGGSSLSDTLINHAALPMAGAVIGGKTPAGPVGSMVGAAAGEGYGSLRDMFQHGLDFKGSDPTLNESPWAARLRGFKEGVAGPGLDNLSHMAMAAGGALGAEEIAPPVLDAVGKLAPKGALGTLGAVGGASALGGLVGHPELGAAVGAGTAAAPTIAKGLRYLGSPAGASEGAAAGEQFLSGMPSNVASKPGMQAQADRVRRAAQETAGGRMAQVPEYLQQQNWGDTASKVGNAISSVASSAFDALKGYGKRAFNAADDFMTAGSHNAEGNPDAVAGAVDYAGQRASELNAGGVPRLDAMKKASTQAGWPLGQSSASSVKIPSDHIDHSVDDVLQGLHDYPEAFGSKGSTSSSIPVVNRPYEPADYAMDNAYTKARGGVPTDQMQSLASPNKVDIPGTGGRNFQTVAPIAPQSNGPLPPQPVSAFPTFEAAQKAHEAAVLSGKIPAHTSLTQFGEMTRPGAMPPDSLDELLGLKRPEPGQSQLRLDELLSGKRASDYATGGGPQPPAGQLKQSVQDSLTANKDPNTIGSSYMPQSVDEGKGLSLPEQINWEQHRAANPGADLNQWYRDSGAGADPNAGKTVPNAIDDLLGMLQTRKRP